MRIDNHANSISNGTFDCEIWFRRGTIKVDGDFFRDHIAEVLAALEKSKLSIVSTRYDYGFFTSLELLVVGRTLDIVEQCAMAPELCIRQDAFGDYMVCKLGSPEDLENRR